VILIFFNIGETVIGSFFLVVSLPGPWIRIRHGINTFAKCLEFRRVRLAARRDFYYQGMDFPAQSIK
jgi:hypothetical protein